MQTGSEVARHLNRGELLISRVVALEPGHLYETGRIAPPGEEVLTDLTRRLGLRVCDRVFRDIVALAARQTWTRDPFDRIIVGQAALGDDLLVTKDRLIRDRYPHAFWS